MVFPTHPILRWGMALIHPFRPGDAAATCGMFAAVIIGAAGRYSAQERADWLPDRQNECTDAVQMLYGLNTD